jgi:hypothetical protein
MKATTDDEIDARDEWIDETSRFEKVQWLCETCSASFIQQNLISEMTSWFEEDDFDKFFDHLTTCWEIETPPETEITRDDH